MASPITLFENRAILVKKETTYGTDSTPVVGDDAMLSFEGSIKVEADKLERNQDLPYFGADPFVLVGKRATVEFTIDMLGAATAGDAAPAAPVLLATGHKETLVAATSAAYAPVSKDFDSVSCYFYHAGLLFKVVGARGMIDWDMEIKNWGKGKVTLTGIITAADISATAPGSLVLTAFRTPPAIETETFTVTVDGIALNATHLTLSHGQDVRMFEGSEKREVSITDRKPTGVLTIFADALGTFNPWSIAESHATKPIVATLDGGATKKAVLTIGQAQLEYPTLTNIDGAMGWEIPFNARPSAGGDEYGLVYT